MTKRKFLSSERFAVWKHHGYVCYWCSEPLRLQETTVDHFIPEWLEQNPTELEKVRTAFNLPSTFLINDYSNWLPCHDYCNKSKAAVIPRWTFQAAAQLEKLVRDADKVREIEQRIRNNVRKDNLLARVMVGLENNTISEADFADLLVKFKLPEDEDIQILEREVLLRIDPQRWHILKMDAEREIAIVSDGNTGGLTPVGRNPHISWWCPNCWYYGPWNGIYCRNCGYPSDPTD